MARIREAQAVVPGAIRRLVEIGLDAVVDPTRGGPLHLSKPRYHFVRLLEPEDREYLEARGIDYWRRNCYRCLATGKRIKEAGHMGAAVHMVARKGSVQAAA